MSREAERTVPQLLLAGSIELGLALDGQQLGMLGRYISLILKWRKHVGLTALRSAEGIANRLVLDSLAVAGSIGKQLSLIDVGSGAGIPGIPLKIARPDLAVTLLEPRSRRAAFLQEAAASLQLSFEVRADRAENVHEEFDWAVAKAFRPPAVWLETGRRLVGSAGVVAAWVVSPAELGADEIISYSLPDGFSGFVELYRSSGMESVPRGTQR